MSDRSQNGRWSSCNESLESAATPTSCRTMPGAASSQANIPPTSIGDATAPKGKMQNKVEEADKLVGLADATTRIIEQLTRGSRQLKILSIVGMPGIGKTTLANSVYKHPSVSTYFHVRAWYRLSHVLNKEALLSSILAQVCQETNQTHNIRQEDFMEKLYRNLKGRKYLIVLDDIWDIKSWNDLKQIFPHEENGSRILFTTRSHAVASQAKSLPCALHLLSTEECCKLLWLKVFNDETCPQELTIVSKHIASTCKGLPLAVVLVAGILKGTERNKDSWEQVATMFTSQRRMQKNILEILEVSYTHLPDHLKQCFLYFGTLPKSTTVSVSKVIRLWISEGFVRHPNEVQKSLKQEAKSYLNDLISRSLLMITSKSSKGGVKACRIHDILQEFCAVRLEKERSMMLKAMFGGIAVLCGDFKMQKSNLLRIFSTTKEPNMPNICSLLYSDKFDMDMDSVGREGGSSKLLTFRNLLPTARRRGKTACEHVCICDRTKRRHQSTSVCMCRSNSLWSLWGLGTRSYKNLIVLDMGNVQVESSADISDLMTISELVNLKYLAVRVCTTQIPPKIGNLQNLETFILTGVIGGIMLPEAIWKLASLRDVITDHCFFCFQYYSQEFFEESSHLDNLNTISTLCICHENVEKFMGRLSNVQKLGCIFPNSCRDYYEASNLFKVLELLCELQSLKMSFHSRAPYPFKFSFPSNLKKLTMSNAHLPWDQISVIGQLPNLEVLKLLNRAFKGQQWDMKEGEFEKLKFLKLDSLDIVQWNASSEHLPRLEQLVVLSCQRLDEIPYSFGEIATLQFIEMKWCSSSATESVKQILQDQRDFSNDQFNVNVVSPATWL